MINIDIQCTQTNDDFNNLCFVLVLTFPVWNFLTEINLGLYITCFYLAIVGYRFFSSEILLKKLIGILLIFLSFSIKSNFAFIVGLSFLEFSYNLLVNKKNDYKNFILIILLSILGFLINTFYFPPYGIYAGYNQLSFEKIIFFNTRILIDYFSFFFFYFSVPLGILIIMNFKKRNKFLFFSYKNQIIYLLLLIFLMINLTPYYLVGKSTDIFNFSTNQ